LAVRVLGVSDFALVQAMPVDEVGSAGSATPAIGLRHLAARLARFGLNQAVLCKSRAKNSGKGG
jgi:hypothetical protein